MTCDACHDPVTGAHVELAVTDTGGGVTPEIQARMFDPFYTTKPVGKGIGMGLSVVHGILHQHGGHLAVVSAPGAGLTMRMLFPVDRGSPDDLGSTGSDELAFDGSPIAARILVVDDEHSVAAFIGELLELQGHRISVANESAEALSRVRSAPHEFDLVISDLTMPVMTGDELALALREIRTDLPIVLCSRYHDTVEPPAVSSMDGVAVLGKPLQSRELLDTVQSLLRWRQGS